MNRLLLLITGNPSMLLWLVLGAFGLGFASGGGTAWTVQGWRLDAVQAKFDGFVAATKAEGEAAAKVAKAKEEEDKRKKVEADRENKKSLDAVRTDNKRLRDERASRSFVPEGSGKTGSPETACFDRPQLESALQQFDREVTEIVGDGDKERVDLDTAKGWAAAPK